MLLTGIQVNRPAGTKLHSRGSDRYVYQVVESVYHKDKRYCTEKKKCIGKMVAGSDILMIPNTAFGLYYPDVLDAAEILPDPPEFSDTLKAGAFIAIRRIAEMEGLSAILAGIYGKKDAESILDIVAYIVADQSSVFQHYPAFMRDHLQLGEYILSDVSISRLLGKAVDDNAISEFLRRWNMQHKDLEHIYIGYDSSNFNCEAENIRLAEFGAAKDDPTRPQVNFAVTVSQRDTTPLDYEIYPGSIVDMSECQYMMERMQDYGYRSVGFLFDRGYYLEENIQYLDENGYEFLIMCCENTKFIRSLFLEHFDRLHDPMESYLPGLELSGISVKAEHWGKKRCFHLYYDEVHASFSRRQFLEKISNMSQDLEKLVGQRLRKNANFTSYKPWFELDIVSSGNTRYLKGYSSRSEKIREHMDLFGHFCLMASNDREADAALETYRGRDNIEKFFRSIKWGMDFRTPGVHTDARANAKFHLIFLSGIIRNRMLQVSKIIKKETKNKRSFTVPGMIDLLEMIECTVNSEGVYKRRYALTAKQKLILEQLQITESDIDTEILAFNKH